MDLLEACNLLIHFGKQTDLDNILIEPILFSKGSTHLALYGFGSIRDERLYHLFVNDKITINTVSKNMEEWFHLMTVHQNRIGHSPTAYLNEAFLPSFLDLVIWGHEHECLIDPMFNEEKEFYVVQPGSSIATSLCEAEAKDKYFKFS